MAYVGGVQPPKCSARFAHSNICTPTLTIVAPPLPLSTNAVQTQRDINAERATLLDATEFHRSCDSKEISKKNRFSVIGLHFSVVQIPIFQKNFVFLTMHGLGRKLYNVFIMESLVRSISSHAGMPKLLACKE